MRAILIALLVLAGSITGASAHHRHHGHSHHGYASHNGRPAAWCGWAMLQWHPNAGGRELWLARNWARVGRPTSPHIGAIVVWSHHVGEITGRSGNLWIVKSGNDGHMVRERARSISGAIAFRDL